MVFQALNIIINIALLREKGGRETNFKGQTIGIVSIDVETSLEFTLAAIILTFVGPTNF